MTTLPAAIARLKADEYEDAAWDTFDDNGLVFTTDHVARRAKRMRRDDCELIAESLVDARPLKPEGLVSEFGFVEDPDWLGTYYHKTHVRLRFWGRNWSFNSMPLNPPPQTHGDLASLILRMERE